MMKWIAFSTQKLKHRINVNAQILRRFSTNNDQITIMNTNNQNSTQNCDKMKNKSLNSCNNMIKDYERKGINKVFKGKHSRDPVSLNSVLSGYVSNGKLENARQLFDKMPSPDIFSWNSIISGYVKKGDVDKAKDLFHRMPNKNVITWNWMLMGYLQNGRIKEGLKTFNEMPIRDLFSLNNVIRAYAQLGNMSAAHKIFNKMSMKNVVTWNMMISGYVKAGNLLEAKKTFDIMPKPNVVSWTAIITGYTQKGLIEDARLLFDKMPEKNVVSWNAMLAGYAQNGNLKEAVRLFEIMPEKTVSSWNNLISVYMCHGRVEEAEKVFHGMISRDSYSWSTLIAGYVQNGFNEEALRFFCEMVKVGFKVVQYIFASVFGACGSLAAFQQGRQIHGYIIKTGFEANVSVANALISMYCECGSIEEACFMFKNMSERDAVSWNAIITGYAHHGCGLEALQLFAEMQTLKVKPNAITFVSVLTACSYAGLVNEGRNLFQLMSQEYGIAANLKHYCCMVDIFCRAGYLKEAQDFINKMPLEPDSTMWGALLSGSRVHGDIDIANEASKRIFELEPENSLGYVLLSNMHAAEGKWGHAKDLRNRMKENSVKKEPGCSWIEVDNKVHVFLADKRWKDQSRQA